MHLSPSLLRLSTIPATKASCCLQEAEDFALFRDPLRAKLYSPDACRNGHCAEPDEGEQTVYGERSYDHRVASCQADAELACCRQR